jgi:hypothetical protein
MSCHPHRRTRVFHNLFVFVLISATGRIALGQANSCPGPTPEDIRKITAALDLCAQVSRIVGHETGLKAFGFRRKPHSIEGHGRVG